MKKLLASLVAVGFLATAGGFAAEAAKCKDAKTCVAKHQGCIKEKLNLTADMKDRKAFRAAMKAIPKGDRKEARKACKQTWRDCCGFTKAGK